MKNNLYFIENQGCDDTTYGLVWVTDENFPKFKSFIENLNKNSHYDCQPVIFVYKIKVDDLKEITYNPFTKTYDCDVEDYQVLHLNDKTYTFSDFKKWWSVISNLECVIKGRHN